MVLSYESVPDATRLMGALNTESVLQTQAHSHGC